MARRAGTPGRSARLQRPGGHAKRGQTFGVWCIRAVPEGYPPRPDPAGSPPQQRPPLHPPCASGRKTLQSLHRTPQGPRIQVRLKAPAP